MGLLLLMIGPIFKAEIHAPKKLGLQTQQRCPRQGTVNQLRAKVSIKALLVLLVYLPDTLRTNADLATAGYGAPKALRR